jgi:hypothetical protein
VTANWLKTGDPLSGIVKVMSLLGGITHVFEPAVLQAVAVR